MSIKNIVIFAILSLSIMTGCSKPTDNSAVKETPSYVVWNEGDVRQIIVDPESTTVLMRVKASVKRDDGVLLTTIEETMGNDSARTAYFYSKNGSIISSTIVRGTDASNPYGEEIFAKNNPTDGETWHRGLGGYDSLYGVARYFSNYNTRLKSFTNVYGIYLIEHQMNRIDTLMTVYYALGIGYIGTESNYFNVHTQLTYLKSGSTELGQMVPAKDPPIVTRMSKSALRHFVAFSILGSKH